MELLLIEDSEDDAEYINSLLKLFPEHKKAASVCNSLEDAEKQLLRAQSFDAIILDLNLPDSFGLQTLESIKRLACKTPIVILTGQHDEQLASEAVRLGAQDYLLKDAVDLDSLRRSILYAIERQHAFEANQMLSTIVGSCTDAVISRNLDGTVLSWNQGAKELYGYGEEEAIGQNLQSILKSKLPLPFAQITNVLLEVGRWQAEFSCTTKAGLEVIVHSRWALCKDSSGRPLMILELSNDVTERYKADAVLRQLSAIVESSDDAIIGKDLNGTITSWNRGAECLYGYTAEEAIGQSILILVPDELRDEVAVVLTRLRNGQGLDHYDTYRRKKNGEVIDVSLTISPLKDAHGNIIGASVISRDITSQKEAESTLLKTNEDLEKKIEARTRELVLLNKELTTARDQAQAASRLKSEFVANMSHEIRTPLNAIIGMASVLKSSIAEEKQKSYAEAIQESGKSLLRVVNDILDFSKIEAGKLELDPIEFDISQVVDSTCTMFSTQVKAKGLSLMSFVDPDLPERLRGDSERVKQILTNLLGNAIKFSNEGEVVLRVTSLQRSGNFVDLHFAISDSGIGLGEEEQEKLFQPFVQADGSTSRKYGGSGLGLSISRKLLDLMNGKIGVHSVKGKGATFWFTIPFEICSDSPVGGKKDELRDVRVLIVDDEPHARTILEEYATSWGMRAGVVADGKSAVAELRQSYEQGDPYRLVIIDLYMPSMNGFELGSEILHDPTLSATRLILMTACDTLSSGTTAVELGFKAYLTKPIKRTELFECIVGSLYENESKACRSSVHSGSKVEAVTPTFQTKELILVAEDHAVNQEVVRLYLEELGLHCHIVSTGKDVLTALERYKIALILMDCQMPEMDGFATTEAIRKREVFSGQHIPIVATTANAMKGDKERCLAAGMDDYISKPLDPAEFQLTLQKWLPHAIGNGVTTTADRLNPIIAPSSGVIDFQRLYGRYQEEDAGRLLRMFLESVPKEIMRLNDAVERADWAAAAASSHGLKGICSVTSAVAMAEICEHIEAVTQAQDLENLRRQIQYLYDAFEKVREQVEARI